VYLRLNYRAKNDLHQLGQRDKDADASIKLFPLSRDGTLIMEPGTWLLIQANLMHVFRDEMQMDVCHGEMHELG
jgi:hypothetical protein